MPVFTYVPPMNLPSPVTGPTFARRAKKDSLGATRFGDTCTFVLLADIRRVEHDTVVPYWRGPSPDLSSDARNARDSRES